MIEIVSRSSRQDDRVQKVQDYERLGIQEYVYIDIRTRRGQLVGEVVGYRLQDQRYIPLLPDEDDALYLATINCRIGLEGGKVWLEDSATGENLLTNLQAQRALRAEKEARQVAEEARQAAEVRAMAEEAARQAAEGRIAELEVKLQLMQQQQKSE